VLSHVIVDSACTIGKAKTEESIVRLLVLGFLAVADVAFEGMFAIATGQGIPLGMFYGAPVTRGQFVLNNLVPVTLGNTTGGGFFVGTICWRLYGREIEQF
jgi:formate/nitrite transporter FocA (FNT family)